MKLILFILLPMFVPLFIRRLKFLSLAIQSSQQSYMKAQLASLLLFLVVASVLAVFMVTVF
ncbi:hypothetical protein [Mongoliitalea daihaiensis]|uniref:hypothetical protein n=1 Tax=Mongoliitalea daihaiensis TaxID=2782006 RepID=UPI001F30785F|nr:hypothetical protein [Mongoliitalea daihaiensis]UJP66097.1 hypothetical protein IPZ59_05595 [Mongoliitalea daihaiensis]